VTGADVPALDPEPVAADYLAKIGAEQLAQRIRAYWSGLGHDQVRVWVEPAADRGAWAVRSNLAGGLPPPQSVKRRSPRSRIARSVSVSGNGPKSRSTSQHLASSTASAT
jgi:hypothetical protein